MREIVLDTETTGFDPNDGHRLVEIGCLELYNYIATGRTFHCYLNPERDVPAEAVAVHGLTDTFLADKPIMATVATNFLEFLGDDTLVIHNAEFDLKFINAELRRVGYKTLTNPVVDTVLMARKKYPGQPANLDALCRRFKIDLSERTLHGALLDAQLLADVYLEMKGGRQQGLELMDAPAAAMTIAATMTAAHTPRVPRVFTVSDAERAAHAALVQTLGDQALWRKY